MKSKPKAFWQYVTSKVKTCPSIKELLCSDGTATSPDAELATMLNDYFSSVFTCEDATSFFVVYLVGGPLISDSIEFTPEIVYSKLQSSKTLDQMAGQFQ